MMWAETELKIGTGINWENYIAPRCFKTWKLLILYTKLPAVTWVGCIKIKLGVNWSLHFIGACLIKLYVLSVVIKYETHLS